MFDHLTQVNKKFKMIELSNTPATQYTNIDYITQVNPYWWSFPCC